MTLTSSDPGSLLGRIQPLAAYLCQSQRLEVVVADVIPVLVGVAAGAAKETEFTMKVCAVRPHELSFGRFVERRLILQISVDDLELFGDKVCVPEVLSPANDELGARA